MEDEAEVELKLLLLSTTENEFRELYELLNQISWFLKESTLKRLVIDEGQAIRKYSQLISKLNSSLADNLLFKHLPMNQEDINYTKKVMALILDLNTNVAKTGVEACIIGQLFFSPRRLQLIKALIENNQKEPSQLLFQFIHNHVIPAIFSNEHGQGEVMQFCDLITTFPMGFAFKFMTPSDIKAFEEYVERKISQLRCKKGLVKDWGTYCSMLIHYSGEILHQHNKLMNAILNIIEAGFRIKSVEDRLMAYDCWKNLIINYSMKEDFLNGSKQMTLLLKPLVVKLSKNPKIAIRRFDTCVCFMKHIKEPNGVLPELLDTIFGPFDVPVWRYCPTKSTLQYIRDSIELWQKINAFFMEIAGRIKNSSNLTNADKLIECARVCTYLNSYYGELDPANENVWKECESMNEGVWTQMLFMLGKEKNFLNKNIGRVAEILEEWFSPHENAMRINSRILLTVIQSIIHCCPMFEKFGSKELQDFATTVTKLAIINCDDKILLKAFSGLKKEWLKLNKTETLMDILLKSPKSFVPSVSICSYIIVNIDGSKRSRFIKDWLLRDHQSELHKMFFGVFPRDCLDVLNWIPDFIKEDSHNLLEAIRFCWLYLNYTLLQMQTYNNLVSLLAFLFSDRILSKVPIELVKETVKQLPFEKLLASRRLIEDNRCDEDLFFCIATLIDKLKQEELVTTFCYVGPEIKNLKPLTPVLSTALSKYEATQNSKFDLKTTKEAEEIPRKFKRVRPVHDSNAELDSSPTVSVEDKKNSSEVAEKSKHVGGKSLQNSSVIKYSKTPTRIKTTVRRATTPKQNKSATTSRKTPTKELVLEELSESRFVHINENVVVIFDKTKMSEQQREATTRRRSDIPAMYNDLSQQTQSLDTQSAADSARSISVIAPADNLFDDNATDEIIQLKETNMDELNNKTVDEQPEPDSININIGINESISSHSNKSKKPKSKKTLVLEENKSDTMRSSRNITPQVCEVSPKGMTRASKVSAVDMNDPNENESDKKIINAELETLNTTENHKHLENTVTPINVTEIAACDSTAELPQRGRGRPRKTKSPSKIDTQKKIAPSQIKTRTKRAESIGNNKDSETIISPTQEEPKTRRLTRLNKPKTKRQSRETQANELTEIKSDKLNCDRKSPSFTQPNASPKNSVPSEDTMTLDIIDNANVTDADTESFFTDEATLNLQLSNNCSSSAGNAASESSIACSPITSDTPKKCSEFIQDTTDISPIVKGKVDDHCEPDVGNECTDEVSVGNYEPKPDSAAVNESGLRRAGKRSAKLLNFFGNVNRSSPISRGNKLSQTVGSPQTSRIRRMILNCAEEKKNSPEICAKPNTQDILTFNREIPSPLAAPKIGILKRKSDVLDDTTSPCAKRKRVNFSDPPTTSEKIYFKRDEENKFVPKKIAIRLENLMLEATEPAAIMSNVKCVEEDPVESGKGKIKPTSLNDLLLANEKNNKRSSNYDKNVEDLEKQIRMDILTKNLLALKACTKDIYEYYEIIKKCFDPSDLELIHNA